MKTLQILILLALIPLCGYSQKGRDAVRFTEIYKPSLLGDNTFKQDSDFVNRKSVSYPFVKEADVMWKKVTWEIIDLREKMNLSLYYPLKTILGRKSFLATIIDGIITARVRAFKPNNYENGFEFDLNDEVYPTNDSIKELDINIFKYTPNTGIPDSVIQLWDASEITQILVKEIWYFDRKYSELKCEIIGLCLVREYNRCVGFDVNSDSLIYKWTKNNFLWVNYSESRDYLATIPVYDQNSDKELYSFDDLFVNRKFKSYFIREANVYNDRYITDYLSGRDAQLESERIKKEIFDYEQDLWEN